MQNCRFYHLSRFYTQMFNFLFTQALCMLFEVSKMSSIRSITGTFSTQECATAYFSLTFEVILHFPWPIEFWPFPVFLDLQESCLMVLVRTWGKSIPCAAPTYVQQLSEFCVGNRPRSIFAKLHANEARVKVKREVWKELSVLENILKLICILIQLVSMSV